MALTLKNIGIGQAYVSAFCYATEKHGDYVSSTPPSPKHMGLGQTVEMWPTRRQEKIGPIPGKPIKSQSILLIPQAPFYDSPRLQRA